LRPDAVAVGALTDFSAKTDEKIARLFWKTASERNSSHFAVERSRNGKSFNEFGKMRQTVHRPGRDILSLIKVLAGPELLPAQNGR
jgi:poly(A) polymerase Pap1